MKRSPLRRQSRKQKARQARLAKMRAEWMASGAWCEASPRFYHPCSGGWVGHHIRQRSLGGSDDRENIVFVCGWAHEWIHDNPARAVKLGLLDEQVKP